MRTIILIATTAAAVLDLSGCVSNPATGHQELSESGKVALQASARIAVRHYLQDHQGRAAEIAANVRAVAATLKDVTKDTTVSGLRATVEAEIVKRSHNPLDLKRSVVVESFHSVTTVMRRPPHFEQRSLGRMLSTTVFGPRSLINFARSMRLVSLHVSQQAP